MLIDSSSDLWFTPPDCLHMTVLEIASSQTPAGIDALVSHLEKTGKASDIANYTFNHRTHLAKPMVSYDTTAMALSFLPVGGDDHTRSPADAYSYHHLRRDVFDQVAATGVQVNSRYAVASAHITIARFITQDGFQLEGPGTERHVDFSRVQALVEKVDDINDRLKRQHWPNGNENMAKIEWIVGQEKGLDFHKGRSWYGEGDAVFVGRGF